MSDALDTSYSVHTAYDYGKCKHAKPNAFLFTISLNMPCHDFVASELFSPSTPYQTGLNLFASQCLVHDLPLVQNTEDRLSHYNLL